MTTKRDPRQDINKKNTNKKKKRDWSFYAIIVCLIIIAIPVTYLGVSIISAWMQQSNPIIEDRFAGDLNPSITDTDLSEIETSAASLEGVEGVFTSLTTGTLRVYVNTDDTLPQENYETLSRSVYDSVIAKLPVATYFTSDASKQQYDLEIHVYNLEKTTDETQDQFIYYLLNKTALMGEPNVQALTEPASAELVETFRRIQEEKDNPTPVTPDTDSDGEAGGD